MIICSLAVLIPSVSVYALSPFDSGSGFLPTPAFSKVKVVYDNNAVPSGETEVNAVIYNDDLILVSDGSILFDITTYP